MTKAYEVPCGNPECKSSFTIDGDVTALTEDKGCVTECPACGFDSEYDYDPAADALTITAGQEDTYVLDEGEDLSDEDEEEEDEDDDEL